MSTIVVSPPLSVGRYLKAQLKSISLSGLKASKKMGLNQSTLSRFFRDEISMSDDMAVKIHQAFGTPLDTLFNMDAEFRIWRNTRALAAIQTESK